MVNKIKSYTIKQLSNNIFMEDCNFKDGMWNEQTLLFVRWHVNRSRSLQEALEAFKTITGWDFKAERLQRLKTAFALYQRYQNSIKNIKNIKLAA